MRISDDENRGPWAIERTNQITGGKTVYAVVRGNTRADAENEAKELNESFQNFKYRVIES